jgi:AcrR family transcriptional regulator
MANIAVVTQPDGQGSGLRSRKIARTRAALIDAAVELCLARGYEKVTIEQIAAAVDIAPRTFSRYFVSKAAVFVAILDDLADEVAAELRAVPDELGPMEAMRVALGAVLARAHGTRSLPGTAERIVRTISVVTASDTLRQAAIDYRGPQVLEAMARRMNAGIDDRRLELAMTLISVTVVHAWTVLAASGVELEPLVISAGIDEAFAELADFTADLFSTEPSSV